VARKKFYFVVSSLKIIGDGNPDNNFESLCIAPPILTLALDGSEWPASRAGRFTPGECALCTHWIGSCVGPGAGLDAVE
jgi:hypothetical protein